MREHVDRSVLVIREAVVREVVTLDDVIALIETAFARDAGGEHVNFGVVRQLDRIGVWDHTPGHAVALVRELGAELDVPIAVASDCERLVREADIVITATPGTGPVVQDAWVSAGQHLTAIGADTAGKQELDPAILRRSTLVVDNLAQSLLLGETQHLNDRGLAAEQVHVELGEIVAGRKAGRQDATAVTVYDATGVTFLDLVVAGAVWRRCQGTGVGQVVRL